VIYGVKLSRRTTKDFDALPNTMRDRVNRSLDDIAADPRGHHSKKLHGDGNLYRWRVGDWRIVYAIHEDIGQVMIVTVAHRREVYR